MSRHLVDLSHPIREGLSTYPGLPSPQVSAHLDRHAAEAIYGPGVTFHIGMITMCTNTGTYLDVPFHRFADGHDLVGLPLERVAGVPGICIDAVTMQVGSEVLGDIDVAGCAVLFRTGHSQHFGTPRYTGDHPYLAVDLAIALVRGGPHALASTRSTSTQHPGLQATVARFTPPCYATTFRSSST